MVHIADLGRVKLEEELLRGTGGALASGTSALQHIYFQEVSTATVELFTSYVTNTESFAENPTTS